MSGLTSVRPTTVREKVSLVIPVYNEEENIPHLHAAIRRSLDSFTNYDHEIVYVDDSSSDRSYLALEEAYRADPTLVKVVSFRRNFGQSAAMAAGVQEASGDIIVFLGADLQNDPADIPKLLAKLDEGYDAICGWRKDRKDNYLIRTFPSRLANRLISRVTGTHPHDYGCTLKVYRRDLLMQVRLYGDMHRFIPALAAHIGARMVEVPVTHHERRFGQSKYGLDRTFKVIIDLMTVKFLETYGRKPMRLFGGLGVGTILAGMLVAAVMVVQKLVLGVSMVRTPLLLLSAIMMLVGVQSILMGLVAEMLMRTYHESQNKPIYAVRTLLIPELATT